MIRCITFDLDDTLWACTPVIQRAEEIVYGWLREHYPRIPRHYTLEALQQDRKRFISLHPELLHDLTRLRRLWMLRLAEDFHYPPELADQGLRLFRHHRNQVTPFVGARELLQRLGTRYTVGAVTNGNAQLDQIGIDHLFDFTVHAADAGAAKPALRFFDAVLSQARVPAQEIVHVGDHPEHDVLGAGQAGFRTVWINTSGRPWDGGRPPDREIRSLDELEAVLEAWSDTS